MHPMDIHAPSAAETQSLHRLLQDAGLPVADLDHAPVTFLVASDAQGLAGAVGIEVHNGAGLLRSLVVRDDLRGSGHGSRLVAACEGAAEALGLDSLTLLTLTAAPFFARRGYAVIARDDAPEALKQSAEFRSICPASATCMHKPLDFLSPRARTPHRTA
ncbi:GNAT family N-acetyltransferase [Luteimonas granuli]|uniref:GNAT family N-acetyltransferase n=2 Tax=Luteimonas granuli TaxID=1176533 RepID=A0A518N2F3_9GAMM|nr:GNAT family N-acetyltransferase [Luteimonas granuli]